MAGACAVAISGFAAWFLWGQFNPSSDDEVDTAFSGMLLLEQYQCRRAETPHLNVRGVEDVYRPGNIETARADRSGLDQPLHIGTRNFDEAGQDADLFDYFELPRDTVSGLLVVRMRPPRTVQNDTLILGSFAESLEAPGMGADGYYDVSIELVDQRSEWAQRADIYWAELESIELRSGESLIDFVRDASRDGVIDLMVGDDTIVDFAGIAYCVEPTISNGLTFWVRSISLGPTEATPAMGASTQSYFTALCSNDPDEFDRFCDPFIGDTPCASSLPMLCYRSGDHAYPGDDVLTHPAFGNDARFWTRQEGPRFWSGGDFALTSPVAGNDIETINDANNYCRMTFGDEWRTADFHIVAPGYRFAGIGSTDYSGRAWVDIRDQPYGTCWGR